MRTIRELPKLKIENKDIEKGLIEIDFVDNVLENPSSVYFIDRYNDLIIDGILETNSIPKKITQIKLKILPTEDNKYYYSLLGIETIIFNLFNRIHKKRIQEDLKSSETFLKIFYIKDEMYNIPVICIEIFFFKKLLNETIDFIHKTLNFNIIYFTGFVGEIKVMDDISKFNLKRILKRPLLIGQPEFQKIGVLKTYDFSEEQIVEMNYIHIISVKQLEMDYILNNSRLSIFDDIRDIINSSKNDFDKFYDNMIFQMNDNINDEEEIDDDLPF